MEVKSGLHIIVSVGEASLGQALGHVGDTCVKWKQFLNDIFDVADQGGQNGNASEELR